jgi:abortive infection bacteriophage resistance protein
MEYIKPHLSFNKQIELLLKRDLLIPNTEYAKNKLQHINYYRLSAYFIPFYQSTNKFHLHTTFEDIIQIYEFDREIRLLLFNAIERVEVFLRSQIAYHFSDKLGAILFRISPFHFSVVPHFLFTSPFKI